MYEKEGIGGDSARCMDSSEILISDKVTENMKRGRKIWQMP